MYGDVPPNVSPFTLNVLKYFRKLLLITGVLERDSFNQYIVSELYISILELTEIFSNYPVLNL